MRTVHRVIPFEGYHSDLKEGYVEIITVKGTVGRFKCIILCSPVVQYRALQGGWKEKKLSGFDKLSGLGDTRVNNCTVLIFNCFILVSQFS